MDNELLSLLQYELGEVTDWAELCPGVYLIALLPSPDSIYPCREYYMVLPDAPISQEARALGRALDGMPGLLYAINPPDEGGWTAVLYELCKLDVAQGGFIPKGWSLADAAMEGMELCPEYFGYFPVPPRTHWGWTLRHQVLDNGIYWLETSQRRTVLAVCNPVWEAELSEGVIRAGKRLAYRECGDEEFSYLFFEYEISCVAIFELLEVRKKWLNTGLIRGPELMNAIWKYAPMYAAAYNVGEQAGVHDILNILLQMLGEDSDPQGHVENMICVNPDAGLDFIGFWK